MSTYVVLSRCRRSIVASAVALVFPLAGLAADNVPPEALNVKVFPDRYVAAGKQFPDLAALEAWAKPIHLRTLWLDSCGNASTRQLLAAVERFYTVYAEGVQIRTFAPEDPGCLEPVADRATPARALPAAYEYLATDRSGRSAMP
jgi:hypothetical protein